MRKFLISLVLMYTSYTTYAANFTPGNIVIVRVGNGSTTLSNASTAVYLDEYTVTGSLVQSVAMPTAVTGSNHALTLSGSAATEGELALSPGGLYLTMTGFDTVPGYAGVSSGVTNRTIARVDANGTVNTTTGFLAGSAFVAGNFRSAVTNDGNEFWAAGSGGTTGGRWYLAFGSFTASAIQTSAIVNSVRDVNIFDGQLYFNTSGPGIYTDGTGLPTTSGQMEAMLTGMPTADSTASPFAFVFLDESSLVAGPDVIDVADNDAAGGIYKYSLVNGSWVSNGNIPNTNALTGVTGFHSCHGSTLYASCPTGVYTITDTAGYNQPITGSYTQIVTGASNTLIHGIAFTPGTQSVTPPVVAIASYTDVKCFGEANGTISTSHSGGYGTLSYNWGGGITTSNRSNLSPGTYTVTVTDGLSCTASAGIAISQPVALTLASDSITNLPCTGGSTGAIKITMAGGSFPYHYNWIPGNINTQNISGQTAGEYKVVVTDDSSCVFTDSFHISQSGSLAFSDSIIAPLCYSYTDGAVYTRVTGGTPGYNYIWSAGLGISSSVTQIPAGSYMVTITDQGGCTLIENISVSAPDSLTLIFNAMDPTTHGGTNGSIVATVAGGTPGYNYLWTGTASTTDSAYDLVAGPYCITATDINGCTVSSCDSLSQPLGLTQLSWLDKFTAYVSNGYINADMISKTQMSMYIAIYDLSGKIIYQNSPAYVSNISLSFPDANVASGVYIVTIYTDHGSVSKKIMVMK
jgi:hypothetical protein